MDYSDCNRGMWSDCERLLLPKDRTQYIPSLGSISYELVGRSISVLTDPIEHIYNAIIFVYKSCTIYANARSNTPTKIVMTAPEPADAIVE